MGQKRLARDRKKRAQAGNRIVFVDETGISLIPNARKTWAKRGKTPILRHQFRWPKLSAIAGITPVGKLYFRVHESAASSKAANYLAGCYLIIAVQHQTAQIVRCCAAASNLQAAPPT